MNERNDPNTVPPGEFVIETDRLVLRDFTPTTCPPSTPSGAIRKRFASCK
ncbi:MAG: hypothetical protein QM589_13530 [Thermomicrobiales bacterium]